MMNHVMNIDEVMNDRELIARILLKKIRTYGDIFPKEYVAVSPRHGTNESLIPMRKSNYLRYAAYLQSDSPQSSLFLSNEMTGTLGGIPSSNAKPLFLESWSGAPEIGYTARLVEYFNLNDISGGNEELDSYRKMDADHQQQDKLYNYQSIRNYLGGNAAFGEVSAQDLKNHPELLYAHVMHELVEKQEKSQDEEKDRYANLAACQILFHDYHIAYFDKERPLFNDDDLKYFQANPRELFYAFMSGEEKLKSLIYDKKEVRENQIMKDQGKEKKNELFDSLQIHVDFVDMNLKKPYSDENYPTEDFDLHGEEAYLFLAAMNQADKQRYNGELLDSGDGKARFSLRYKGSGQDDELHIESDRFDLGYLGYGNKSSIAECLNYLSVAPSAYLLKEGKISAEEHKKLEEDVATVLKMFEKEEKAYLAKHKEIQDINAYRGKEYVYICRKSDFDEQKNAFFLAKPVSPEEMKEYYVVPVGKAFEEFSRDISTSQHAEEQYKEYTVQRDGLPDSMVAFRTPLKPTNSMIASTPVLCVFSKDDMEELRSIRDFEVKVSVKKEPVAYNMAYLNCNMMYGFENELVLTGYEAMKCLERLNEKDTNDCFDAVNNQIYIPGENPLLSVSLKFSEDDQWHTESYKYGIGDIGSKVTLANALGYPENAGAQNVCNAFKKIIHLSGDIVGIDFKGTAYKKPDMPTKESSLKTFEQENQKPVVPVTPYVKYFQDCYDYYIQRALMDEQNDSVRKAVTAATIEMATDGFTAKQIEYIAGLIAHKEEDVHYIAGTKEVGKIMQDVLNNNKDIAKVLSDNSISR